MEKLSLRRPALQVVHGNRLDFNPFEFLGFPVLHYDRARQLIRNDLRRDELGIGLLQGVESLRIEVIAMDICDEDPVRLWILAPIDGSRGPHRDRIDVDNLSAEFKLDTAVSDG